MIRNNLSANRYARVAQRAIGIRSLALPAASFRALFYCPHSGAIRGGNTLNGTTYVLPTHRGFHIGLTSARSRDALSPIFASASKTRRVFIAVKEQPSARRLSTIPPRARRRSEAENLDPMTKRRITCSGSPLSPRLHPTGGIQLAEMTNRNFPEHRSIQSGSDESGEHEFVLSNRADWPERHCDRLGTAEVVSVHTRGEGRGYGCSPLFPA